jgi:prepilin-type N-terminal cleavage/methylation domain-containing protein
MKRGFGLLEVLVAAVVLAFLLVGLNLLQKGNRESILRVRARDAANEVAQDVIDSISAIGSASVAIATRECPEIFDENHDLCRKRAFTGSVSRQLKDTMNIEMPYWVKVDVKPENPLQVAENQTDYLKAQALNLGGTGQLDARHLFAKQVDVTVKWKFKNSNQSIEVSALVR